MKKSVITCVLLCLISFMSMAQSDSISSVIQKQFDYCELVGTSGITGARTTVKIDFGQRTKIFEDTRLKGPDGRAIRFNSMIDALNFMGSDGWELVQVYTTSTTSATTPVTTSVTYHYLLKREVKK